MPKCSRGSVTLHDAMLLLFCHIPNLKPETLRNWPEVAQLLMADPGLDPAVSFRSEGPFTTARQCQNSVRIFRQLLTHSSQPAPWMWHSLPANWIAHLPRPGMPSCLHYSSLPLIHPLRPVVNKSQPHTATISWVKIRGDNGPDFISFLKFKLYVNANKHWAGTRLACIAGSYI